MNIKTNIPPHKQIRNFIFMIFLGVLTGVLVVGGLLIIYAPSGSYKSGNVLISPDVLNQFWYTSQDKSSGQKVRFVFKEIEYLYFNKKERKWNSIPIKVDWYGTFYTKVKGDRSLAKDSQESLSEFDQAPPVRILIKGETKGKTPFEVTTEVFQEIQFSENGNTYRVEVREEGKDQQWAYFKHKDILNTVKQLFE